MRTTQKIFTVAAALVVALSFGTASADCGANPGVISTQGAQGQSLIWTTAFQADPSFFYGSFGGTTYCGAYNGCTPVFNPVVTFWAQGSGDPANGVGNDNGGFDLVAGMIADSPAQARRQIGFPDIQAGRAALRRKDDALAVRMPGSVLIEKRRIADSAYRRRFGVQ